MQFGLRQSVDSLEKKQKAKGMLGELKLPLRAVVSTDEVWIFS